MTDSRSVAVVLVADVASCNVAAADVAVAVADVAASAAGLSLLLRRRRRRQCCCCCQNRRLVAEWRVARDSCLPRPQRPTGCRRCCCCCCCAVVVCDGDDVDGVVAGVDCDDGSVAVAPRRLF